MPKIVIKEIDKTKAGLGEYSNFTVFVPGFARPYNTVDPNTGSTVQVKAKKPLEAKWDDNGVIELSSQEDFDNWVGKVPAKVHESEAVAPILSQVGTNDQDQKVYKRTFTPVEFFASIYTNHLYTKTDWGSETPFTGRLCAASDIKDTSGTTVQASAGKYVLVKPAEYNSANEYYYIAAGNEGADAVVATPQIGNQIAYELLGLGYKVLFKKITSGEIDANPAVGTTDHISNSSFWEPFKDKAAYDFRYIITGFCGETVTVTSGSSLADIYSKAALCIGEIANSRGDCIALLDVPETVYSSVAGWKSAIVDYAKQLDSTKINKYSALFMPTVTYAAKDADYNNATFPGYFHYLVCASDAFVNYPEWFAVAGYTRGISTTHTVAGVGLKLGDAAINAFEPRCIEQTGDIDKAINVIATIRGSNYVWGNRTAHKLGDLGSANGDLVASHFLNIRQLCCTLKKELYNACRRFTFDPNSDVLWINFCNAISPLLDKMKANQGIEDYRIIKVPTDKKATLQAKIRIVPIEAVEDFDIELFLEGSITGTSVEIDESTGTN